MKIAFSLFEYSPYSGLSLDFGRILAECQNRGHDTHVFVSEWHGERPKDTEISILPPWRWASNHRKNLQFHAKFKQALDQHNFDIVVGFNKMPDLDIYYGADICYIGRTVPRYPALYKLTTRYKHRYLLEASVFSTQSKTLILSLSEKEKSVYQEHYFTPDSRFYLLPPTLDHRFSPVLDRTTARANLRAEIGIPEADRLLMFIGSGFATKGLDRVITSLASLPQDLLQHTHLVVVGEDDTTQYQALAKKLTVLKKIHFLGGRSREQIPELLAAGDLMVHPAYGENTGTVLLEAIAAGLPVLATDTCGYAHHIESADAGIVLASPFEQRRLNDRLSMMLTSAKQKAWSKNGSRYGKNPTLYQMPTDAVTVIEQHYIQKEQQIVTTASRPETEDVYLRRDLAWANFAKVMSIGSHEPAIRDVPETKRRTVSFGANGKRYYVKTHGGVGWKEILKNLAYFRLPVLGAEHEWRGVHHLRRQTLLRDLGLNTLEIAGYGTREYSVARILSDPARRQSFIVTDEIPNAKSLEELCRDDWAWGRRSINTCDEVLFKRCLIDQLARTAQILHQSGANHRDFYLGHFLMQQSGKSFDIDPGESRLFLIDLHRMQIHRPSLRAWVGAMLKGMQTSERIRPPISETPERWRIKDVAGLYYSSMDLGLTRHDLCRFMTTYGDLSRRQALQILQLLDNRRHFRFAQSSFWHRECRFWWRVYGRARKLYASEKRRSHTVNRLDNRPLPAVETQH